MKEWLSKHPKIVGFVIGVVGLAAVQFLGMDKAKVDGILGGCQPQVEAKE